MTDEIISWTLEPTQWTPIRFIWYDIDEELMFSSAEFREYD